MKAAIIGSRNVTVENIEKYIPPEATEIVSGGAKGVDRCAREYAVLSGIKLTEFLPEYEKYGRAAPIKRNDEIIEYADIVLAFWDGKSRGTEYVIKKCQRSGKNIKIFYFNTGLNEKTGIN